MKIAQTRKLHAAGILPKPAPAQEPEALRERLEALRLPFAAEGLDGLQEVQTAGVQAGAAGPHLLGLRATVARYEMVVGLFTTFG